MIRVLNRFGHPTHFEEIHRELEQELPEHLLLSIRNTSAWLERNKELFAWAGPGTYGLTSWEMGHSTSTPSDPSLRPARRRGIGDEIVNLLLTWGRPMSIREIKDHVLKRFVVKEDSVMASIRQDQAQRFTELPGDFVGLAVWDGEEQPQSVASRGKGWASQSNEEKLWQHILRRYDHESADFPAKEWNA